MLYAWKKKRSSVKDRPTVRSTAKLTVPPSEILTGDIFVRGVTTRRRFSCRVCAWYFTDSRSDNQARRGTSFFLVCLVLSKHRGCLCGVLCVVLTNTENTEVVVVHMHMHMHMHMQI